MRRVFNTSCDLYYGPDSPYGSGLYFSCPCRLVPQRPIETVGWGAPLLPFWLTLDAVEPTGAWTTRGFGMNAGLADQVAVPAGDAPRWWIVYVDQVIYGALTPYYRAYLADLPLPTPNNPATPERIILTCPPFPIPKFKLTVPEIQTHGPRIIVRKRSYGQVAKINCQESRGGVKFRTAPAPNPISPVVKFAFQEARGPSVVWNAMKGKSDLRVKLYCSATYSPPPCPVVDHFVDAHNTSLQSHTPDSGGPWSAGTNWLTGAALGTWTIDTNNVTQTNAATTYSLVSIQAGISDCTAKMRIVDSVTNTFIIFRLKDSQNYWYFGLGTTTLYLGTVRAGVQTNYSTTTTTYDNTKYLTVVLSGTSISCSYNGATLNRTDSGFQTETKFGMMMYASQTCHADDFSVCP